MYRPLVCFTDSKLAANGVMTWTSDDGTLTVSGQRILLTDHDATVGFLRGTLPARTWAHLRSVLIAPVFASTETAQLKALDSNLERTDRFFTETVQTSETSTGVVEANRAVDMVIPVAGVLELDLTSALTNGDDVEISAWGHVYTEPFRT